jgi:anti-sigma regulatory factor (Ser/Thr protein kinase)
MNRPTAPAAVQPERTHARRAVLRSWRHLALTLPADAPELLAPIRRLIKTSLLDWGADPERAADIELSACELLTNAQRHSHGPARLVMSVRAGAVHLEVSDTSTHAPREIGPDAEGHQENGKGLHIVKALAFAATVRIHPGWGKTVKASFDLT